MVHVARYCGCQVSVFIGASAVHSAAPARSDWWEQREPRPPLSWHTCWHAACRADCGETSRLCYAGTRGPREDPIRAPRLSPVQATGTWKSASTASSSVTLGPTAPLGQPCSGELESKAWVSGMGAAQALEHKEAGIAALLLGPRTLKTRWQAGPASLPKPTWRAQQLALGCGTISEVHGSKVPVRALAPE